MDAIIDESLNEKVTSLAGIPSWMLILLQNVLKKTKKSSISDVWPLVEVYFHGGVSFSPYKEQFESLFKHNQINFYETYNASEGFFGIQDRNKSDELLLMLDYGIFYEFIPFDKLGLNENEVIMPLSEVEIEKNYAMVISTNAGLWRYKIGDTIKFTSLSPYRIKITGRTKAHINVFGEELMIENTESAMSKTANKLGLEIIDYTVGPNFINSKTKGSHQWIIEFRENPKNINTFSKILDDYLKDENSDYEAKRYKNITLGPPKIILAKRNLFYIWLGSKNKLGGQHKVPRLSNSRKILNELLEMNN